MHDGVVVMVIAYRDGVACGVIDIEKLKEKGWAEEWWWGEWAWAWSASGNSNEMLKLEQWAWRGGVCPPGG